MNDLTGTVAITLTFGASPLRGRRSYSRLNVGDMLVGYVQPSGVLYL